MSTTVERPRGTTNTNVRGSSEDRRRRKEYLLDVYAANKVVVTYLTKYFGRKTIESDPEAVAGLIRSLESWGGTEIEVLKACRCYRCGALLTEKTLTVDRIKPGCLGGTYKRENIRPSCPECMSITGGKLGAAQRARKKVKA